MLQDDKVILRSLKDIDLPVLAQLANNKKIWLNVRDMLPHPYTLADAIFFFNYKRRKTLGKFCNRIRR
jgi:hypothetical protein